ncbi:MAG: hypothetical protein RLZZ546_1871 [Bacteroidota bacterium]|jgi:hypothetical protein
MNKIILFLFFPFAVNGQFSIVEILSKFRNPGEVNLIKENYSELTYMMLFDEEEVADTTITFDEIETKYKLYNKKNTTYKENKLIEENASNDGNTTSTNIYTFNNNGFVVAHDLKLDGEMSMMNESKQYTYDDKNRITKVRLLKENMKVDNVVFEAAYEDGLLPSYAKMNIMLDMEIKKEVTKNGFRYNFLTKIPQDLIDMAKKEMGGNPTEAEILKELGSFGKIQKKYSDVTTIANGDLKEDIYEEDKEKAGKMDLIATLIFDKNYNILSKKIFSKDADPITEIYEYTKEGKVLSMQIGSEEKKINEFDAAGNLIKEHKAYGYILRKYEGGKLVKEMDCSDNGSATSFSVYKY